MNNSSNSQLKEGTFHNRVFYIYSNPPGRDIFAPVKPLLWISSGITHLCDTREKR